MRILALRGENLASLTREFAIDFTQGSLGAAGLFAITGNTGAGKSSLLDAICLALYDQMARLVANRKFQAEIGREEDPDRLKANDVRQILSRGKASGYAEVDFVATDGLVWRARWQVRRARLRADGKYQKQERQLECLSNRELHSGTKRDVQERIDQLVGLSWEQFRRAVILPQGDFAAFLKAGVDERSALLERMTGTELYSRLSVAAYERGKAERQKLDWLTEQKAALGIPDPDERQTLQQEYAAGQQQLTACRQQLELARQVGEARQQAHELDRARHDAVQAVQEQEAAWLAAQEDRQQLQMIDRVQVARPLFDELKRTQLELVELDQTIQAQQQKQDEAISTVQYWQQQRTLCEQRKQQLDAEIQRSMPELTEARELDGLLQEKDRQQKNAQAALLAAQHERSSLLQSWQQGELQQQQRARQRQDLAQWLERNASIGRVAQKWQPLFNTLKETWQDYRRQRQGQLELQALRHQLVDKQQLREQLDREWRLAREAHVAAAEQLARLETERGPDELQDRQQALQQARLWVERSRQMGVLAEQAAQLVQHRQALLQDEQHGRTRLASLESQAQELATEHMRVREQLELSAHELGQAQARQHLQEYRQQLQHGEACPLCGSPDHPWAGQPADADSVLQRLLSQQHFLQALAEQRQQALLEVRLQAQQWRERLHQQEQQLEMARGQLAQWADQWAALQAGLDDRLPAWPAQPEDWLPVLAGLVRGQHLAQQHWQQKNAEWEQWRQWQQEQQQRRQESAELQQIAMAAERHQQDLHVQLTEMQTRLQALEQQLGHLDERLQLNANQLDQQLTADEWRGWLRRPDAERVLQAWQQDCEQYLQYQELWQQLDQQYQQAQPEQASRQARVEAAERQGLQWQQSLGGLQSEIAALGERRQHCLSGRPVAMVEADWQQRREQAQQALTQAERQCQHLAEQQSASGATLASLRERQQQVTAQRREVLRDWLRHIQQLGVAEYELQQWLSHPLSWVQQERERLQHLSDSLNQVRTRLTERDTAAEQLHRRLAQLQSSLPEAAQADEAGYATWLTTRQAELAELEQVQMQRQSRLLQAESLLSRLGELETEWQQQQAVSARWESLAELIGSASGAKFRTFAQSLTLERLLLVANTHLDELAARYQLQRVPGTDLALQVLDRDMGDEIRGVESLSGGESFLVSLALALGLASLSGQETQVDSLFIDEGFGTLDPESLDTAIACLDSLQASGRQIGVISHVPALVERIGVQVRVEALGGGESRVIVPDDYHSHPESVR